jgi:hypothetical protein
LILYYEEQKVTFRNGGHFCLIRLWITKFQAQNLAQFLAQENKVNKKRFQLISETFTGIDFPFVARPRVELGTLGL